MDFKQHIGETVYLLPTGNNQRYHQDKIIEATITKVGRVFVTITRASIEDKYRISSWGYGRHLEDGYNGGWHVFTNLEELNQFKQSPLLITQIVERLRSVNALPPIEYSTLVEINKLLELPDIEQ